MLAMLGAAGRGDGQVAVIRGPAGIGKTRLAEEIAARARDRGARVAMGRCWQDGEAPPLWPWRAILRDLGAPGGILDERQGEPPQGRFGRFLAVLDHLRAAARATPRVIVVDDIHLGDPATLLLARFLVRERRGLPLLLLLTRRDETPGVASEVIELLSELERDATAVPLGGLSEDAVRAFLSASGVRRPTRELSHAVATITRGNPLHLRSVTRRGDLGADGVLGGLEEAVGRLVHQLSGTDRRVIALAALLGADVSVHEVARVADTSPVLAAESLARAAGLGLAAELADGRFGFVHELVRQSALSSLTLPERLDAHARAARLVTGHEPDRMLRRAHHAFAAASRSGEDAETAVQIARDVAAALQAADGFESAAALLGRAVEIHDAAALVSPAAELAVEWAESVLACGRLAEARPLFQRAARIAETEGDTLALARAALGLGGVWLREHRRTDEAERMLALQRRALEALPVEATVLRARLTVRLAAEDAYRGRPVTPVLDGVDAARRTGDARALAEALSLCHHALLTQEHNRRRLELAEELIAVAAAAGDGLFSLLGLCWRATNLFLLGEPSASAALAELRLRADAVRCRSVLFIVRALDVMLAIRAGRFAEAETAAADCFQLGTEVGDADALAYHGAHLSAIRFFQGREAELADLAVSIAESPTLIPERERAFASAAALFALRAGRPQAARALLDRLRRDGLGSIPASTSWLLAMTAVVELARVLEDRGIAQAVYDVLLPYAELPVMASLAIVCFGSAHRALGVAALTCGRLDVAIEHFAAAVLANERLGHRPAAIQTQAELGLAHLRRAGDGDVRRGWALVQEAIAAGEAIGMDGLVAGWRDALLAADASNARPEGHAARMALAQPGRWRVVLDNQVATVPDRVGMRYLARLVAAPDRDIPALALVIDEATSPIASRPDLVMDRAAVTALRERIGQLRGTPSLSPGEQDELVALTRELARAVGLGGRIRTFVDAPERARTAVRKAIKRAIVQISAANPSVGQHLARRIETGAVCRYRMESSGSSTCATTGAAVALTVGPEGVALPPLRTVLGV